MSASSSGSTPHSERTATEPRQEGLHRVRICQVRNVNPRVRLVWLALPYAIKFLPGQWLDVHIPALPNHTGGFTITSTPADASYNPSNYPLIQKQPHQTLLVPPPRPYLELAIQKSPRNPPAAWLWRNENEIINQHVHVRVGGSFTWPPLAKKVQTAVFVAGGVGINPLISMLSHLAQPEQRHAIPNTIKLLYATRLAGGSLDQVLFLPRIKQLFEDINHIGDGSSSIDLHVTDDHVAVDDEPLPDWFKIRNKRISHSQIISSLDVKTNQEGESVAYVCGPPAMTDEVVEILRAQKGMQDSVLCEKWW